MEIITKGHLNTDHQAATAVHLEIIF